MAKAMTVILVSLTKEVNENSFLRGHEYGGYDVRCKHFIVYIKLLQYLRKCSQEAQ